ncbi:MAG: hypothetical protein QOG57_6337, partial [Pseudonocardiales bacterium]|nr:hypothetical protein [Pseudonocardiales bacterium]
ALGAQVTLLEAGGYEHLDKQISQVEDLSAGACPGPGEAGRRACVGCAPGN